MTTIVKPIVGQTLTGGTVTSMYTCPVSTNATLFSFIILNPTGVGPSNYWIWVSPSGAGTPGSSTAQPANYYIANQPLSVLERHSITDRVALATGDTVFVLSDTSGTVMRGTVLETT